MTSVRWRSALASLVLCVVLFLSACSVQAPSRFEQAQKETTARGAAPAVAKTAEQGSSFNKFFPGSAFGYEVVAAQEKKGFAEYKLNKDGKNVAMFSINDITSNPTAAQKFKSSTTKIGGFPSVEQGQLGTAILVGDRYQVKVLSRDPAFTKENRADWLTKFNLNGLAKLK
jgi:hypothetical protein